MDLNSFMKWQSDDVCNRDVSIKIRNDQHGKQEVVIYCYDATYRMNQRVYSVDEIDLPAEKRRQDLADLKRLQSEYPTGVE